MGKPSDRKRRAKLGRLGKRERARVKKRRALPIRGESSCSVVGAGTYRVKAGRNKRGKVDRYVRQLVNAHLAGDSSTSKSGISIKRPTYSIEMGPTPYFRSAWDWPGVGHKPQLHESLSTKEK